MVVRDLDVRRAFRRPNKAHPELVVDPDRMLSLAVAHQCLKTVTWRGPQVSELAGGIEIAQFPPRHLDEIGWNALRTLPVEDGFGGPVPKAPDHRQYVSSHDTNVKADVSINDTFKVDRRWGRNRLACDAIGLIDRIFDPASSSPAVETPTAKPAEWRCRNFNQRAVSLVV